MSEDDDVDVAVAEPEAATDEVVPKKKFNFPTALTVLAAILALVWVATFLIPSGIYQTDENGPIPGSYERLEQCADGAESVAVGGDCVDKSITTMIGTGWTAIPNGLYGVENPDTGFVGAFETGDLFGAAQIFLFVLATGAFITITMKTGAIDAGLGRLALRFEKSPQMLVIVIMIVFGIGGTTYGMWEETLGYFPLIVPLAVALGYDRMTGAGIILLGAGSGVIASTVNPFATGVASDAAGISISDGIGIRLAMWVVFMAAGISYVLWYGNRVRKDPSKSVLGADGASFGEAAAEVPELTGKRKIILVVFGAAFMLMVYGFIPWNDVWVNIFDSDYPLPVLADLFGDFFFAEAAMLFLVAAVIVGLIDRMNEADIVNTIIGGAADFLSAGLVIVAARAITVVMKSTYVTDTVLNVMETAVDGSSPVVFGLLAWIANIPIAFLVPSSSGHAGLVMPILGPVAGFADVEGSTAVTAYQSASGWVNLITPTSAVILSGLTISKIGYNKYIRFVWPFMLITFVLISAFVGLSAVTA